MKKNSVVFVDTSAWVAILDEKDPNYQSARNYYSNLIEQNARLVTASYVIDETLSLLKMDFGGDFAKQFLSIIDESVLTINLKSDWISRRVRRMVLQSFLKSSNNKLKVKHFYVSETLKRKNVDIVFSYDDALKHFDFPVMPQNM